MRQRVYTEDELYEAAVRALTRRDRSHEEMHQWLRLRTPRPAMAQAVIARLRDHGYLNDERVAASLVAWQRDGERHGARRAARELGRRGISRELATKALAEGYGQTTEAVQLRAYIRRKRTRPPQSLRETASLFRKWLLAGFSPAACQTALRAWKLDADWVNSMEEVDLSGEDTPVQEI